MGTTRRTRGRTMLLGAAGVSALVATALVGAMFSSDPAYAATTVNPMAAAGDFTIMTESDATFSNDEVEGSVAVGGTSASMAASRSSTTPASLPRTTPSLRSTATRPG